MPDINYAPDEVKARLAKILEIRNIARTNLLFLCNEILGYKEVSRTVHGEILDHLQKFKGCEDLVENSGKIKITPKVPIELLEGHRDNLIIFPRGHFKTSIITIAHSVQWIINYPDIRMCLSMAIGDQTQKVMTELKGIFQYNKRFRMIFPDYCPVQKKVGDWGNMEQFTVPNRTRVRKEPTVCLVTIGKVMAGSHYDVVKNSDLVDENNVKTPNQIADVISHFGHMDPLVERYPSDDPEKPVHGWQDVEGTIYDFGDLYVTIAGGSGVIYDLLESPPRIVKGGWNCLIRGAMKKDGTTLDMKRFPPKELERIQEKPEMSAKIFSCQYLSKPIPDEGGLCDSKDVVFLSRQILNDIQPMLRIHCTIDLHGMEPAKNDNDYTVLTVGGFDRDGRFYVLDIRRGRFTPDQVIWQIFNIYDRWKPIDFKIEKDAHARVLLPFLQRESSKRQRFPTMVPIKRDNHTSKQQRIRGLQSWFKAGIIRFANDLGCKTDLLLEIMQFPSQSSGVHDDCLDTLADMMYNQEGGATSDVWADGPDYSRAQFGIGKGTDKFLGFGPKGQPQWMYQPDNETEFQYHPTGVM